jgi:lysophospholipase L1-like esterase
VTLQNPRRDQYATRQAEVVAALRRAWSDSDTVRLIDVFSAYQDAGTPAAYVQSDGFHPSPEGERAWARVVLAALGSEPG